MSFAVITVDKIDRQESNYIHFIDKSQKAWNCNVVDLFDIIVPGERVVIDYKENPPAAGRKYGTKYVNRARLWQEGDGENTWPDKEPYTGGAPKSGGNKVGKDYDPEIGKRQTAANCAIQWCVAHTKGEDEFAVMFPAIADIILKWVNEAPKSGDDGTVGSSSQDDFGGGGFKF